MNRRITATFLAALTALSMSACSSEEPAPKEKDSKPSQAAQTPAAPADEPAQGEWVPKDREKLDALMIALHQVDPSLAEDERDTEMLARNVCLDVENGNDAATIVKNTATRAEVDEETAGKAVEEIKEHYCA